MLTSLLSIFSIRFIHIEHTECVGSAMYGYRGARLPNDNLLEISLVFDVLSGTFNELLV